MPYSHSADRIFDAAIAHSVWPPERAMNANMLTPSEQKLQGRSILDVVQPEDIAAQRHATRSLSALAEVVGPPRGRWCIPMGAWAD
jgi:hypothetical protein